ncbi:MAG: type VI secretion system-associated FHA domain protein TagH [Gammaproteobacteria bacterium]
MLIRIEVVAYNEKPLPKPLAGEFDEMGGSIGRGRDSTLMLPDPDRHVSRTHAVIMFRAGGYVIQDKGSAMPVHVNGRPVGNGHEVPVAHGDELRIGGYTLRVSVPVASVSAPHDAAAIPGPAKDDPLAAFGGVASATADPFADLMQPPPASRSPASATPPAPDPFAAPPGNRYTAPSGGVIPADFDPFADPVTPGPSSASLPDDLDFGLEGAARQRFDELFDNGAPASRDPLASHAQPSDSLGIAGIPTSDPLVALGMVDNSPAEFQPAQRDDTPELNSAFRPPRVKPDDMVLSWEASQAPTPVVPKTAAVSTSAPDAPSAASTPQSKPPAPLSSQVGAQPVMASAADEQLLRAFLHGAGVPDLEVPGGLTTQWMQLLGQVMREATQGTLDLLLARALTKREVRADVTMIVARENNPLKFSPNVEAALLHLLVPQERGFMGPQQALHDAYDDLRSHQFGFMVGMRAALADVLQRFDPEKLAQRLTQQRVLDAVLPMYRKANLWDLFSELYGEISKEAEDDFHSLFGREFLRAYQEQINKLRQGSKDSKE